MRRYNAVNEQSAMYDEDDPPMANVVIYTTSLCPFCFRAKRLLEKKGARFEEISVDGDPDERAAMQERSGRHTVPQIFIGDRHVGGFDDLAELDMDGELDELLAS